MQAQEAGSAQSEAQHADLPVGHGQQWGLWTPVWLTPDRAGFPGAPRAAKPRGAGESAKEETALSSATPEAGPGGGGGGWTAGQAGEQGGRDHHVVWQKPRPQEGWGDCKLTPRCLVHACFQLCWFCPQSYSQHLRIKVYPVAFSLKEDGLAPASVSISKGMKIHLASTYTGRPDVAEAVCWGTAPHRADPRGEQGLCAGRRGCGGHKVWSPSLGPQRQEGKGSASPLCWPLCLSEVRKHRIKGTHQWFSEGHWPRRLHAQSSVLTDTRVATEPGAKSEWQTQGRLAPDWIFGPKAMLLNVPAANSHGYTCSEKRFPCAVAWSLWKVRCVWRVRLHFWHYFPASAGLRSIFSYMMGL